MLELSPSMTLFILWLRLLQLWPLGALSDDFCVPLTYLHLRVCVHACVCVCVCVCVLSTSLLSGTIKHSRLILYISRPVLCVLVAKSCLTLCNPMDCSPPGSSVHGIFWTRILEWVAIPFSRGSSWPKDRTWSPALQAASLPLSHQRRRPRISSHFSKESWFLLHEKCSQKPRSGGWECLLWLRCSCF